MVVVVSAIINVMNRMHLLLHKAIHYFQPIWYGAKKNEIMLRLPIITCVRTSVKRIKNMWLAPYIFPLLRQVGIFRVWTKHNYLFWNMHPISNKNSAPSSFGQPKRPYFITNLSSFSQNSKIGKDLGSCTLQNLFFKRNTSIWTCKINPYFPIFVTSHKFLMKNNLCPLW